MLSISSYKSPLEFRKRNTTATLDTARFQYIPADERHNTSIMVFVGSPMKTRDVLENQKDTTLDGEEGDKTSYIRDQEQLNSIQLLRKEDESDFKEFIQRVKEGLLLHKPEMCSDGLNGSYFLRDRDGIMAAIFKPQDEEGNSENNPKREDPHNIIDKGILDGEGAQREVAAYLLDKELGFVGVPMTTMVKIIHPSFGKNAHGEPLIKIGSLQMFVENDGESWDIGFGAFPTLEVQKIAAFDLRIFNNDRHGGNMLMKRHSGTYTLVPIDHGFSLPSSMSRAWFDWLTWPQIQQPIMDDIKDYISNIDLSKDVETLQKIGIRMECLRTMKISTMLLKKGCKLGFTLYDIASLVSRAVLEEPCELELWYQMAQKKLGIDGDLIATSEDEERLLEVFEKIMDEQLMEKKALQ